MNEKNCGDGFETYDLPGELNNIPDLTVMEWVAEYHPEILDDDMPDYADDNYDDYFRWLIESAEMGCDI